MLVLSLCQNAHNYCFDNRTLLLLKPSSVEYMYIFLLIYIAIYNIILCANNMCVTKIRSTNSVTFILIYMICIQRKAAVTDKFFTVHFEVELIYIPSSWLSGSWLGKGRLNS